MKRFRILNVLLIALILLGAWRTVEVWRRKPPEMPAADEAPRPPGDGLPAAERKPEVSEMVEVIAQNDLFDVSRKEAQTGDMPVPDQTPAPPPTLKLSGVRFIGLEPEAVVTDAGNANQQIRLRQGEEISGYRVDRIGAESVVLKTGTGEEVVLSLLLDTTNKGGGNAYGPGGRPTPQAASARTSSSSQTATATSASTTRRAGSFAPNEAQSEAERRREDARARAERARERLKRLRAEAERRR